MANSLYNPADIPESPPPSGVLVPGYFRKSQSYVTHRSKGTNDWLLTFTLSGRGAFYLEDQVETCEHGDVIMLSPGTPHHYVTSGDIWEFMWVHFVPQPEWAPWFQTVYVNHALIKTHVTDVSVQQRLRAAFQRLIGDCEGFGVHRQALAMNAMEEILLVLTQRIESENRGVDPRIDEVLHHLANHFAEPLTIDELAALTRLSPSRLSHLFKAQVGESIIDTLIQLRLRHAARLLARTTERIVDIAALVGFQSPYYFSRKFHSQYGLSPSEYRKQHGK